MVEMFGGDVAYLSLAISGLLPGPFLREELDWGGTRGRCAALLPVLVRFMQPIALHFGILAEVMFLARAKKNGRRDRRAQGGAKQTQSHSHAILAVNVSNGQSKVSVLRRVLH